MSIGRPVPTAAELACQRAARTGHLWRTGGNRLQYLSHQSAGEFSRKLFRNGEASKTPEKVITFVVIVSVREMGHLNPVSIVKGVHRF